MGRMPVSHIRLITSGKGGAGKSTVSVYLGGGRLGGLTPLLEGLEEGGYRVCAWRLTASQHLFST